MILYPGLQTDYMGGTSWLFSPVAQCCPTLCDLDCSTPVQLFSAS